MLRLLSRRPCVSTSFQSLRKHSGRALIHRPFATETDKDEIQETAKPEEAKQQAADGAVSETDKKIDALKAALEGKDEPRGDGSAQVQENDEDDIYKEEKFLEEEGGVSIFDTAKERKRLEKIERGVWFEVNDDDDTFPLKKDITGLRIHRLKRTEKILQKTADKSSLDLHRNLSPELSKALKNLERAKGLRTGFGLDVNISIERVLVGKSRAFQIEEYLLSETGDVRLPGKTFYDDTHEEKELAHYLSHFYGRTKDLREWNNLVHYFKKRQPPKVIVNPEEEEKRIEVSEEGDEEGDEEDDEVSEKQDEAVLEKQDVVETQDEAVLAFKERLIAAIEREHERVANLYEEDVKEMSTEKVEEWKLKLADDEYWDRDLLTQDEITLFKNDLKKREWNRDHLDHPKLLALKTIPDVKAWDDASLRILYYRIYDENFKKAVAVLDEKLNKIEKKAEDRAQRYFERIVLPKLQNLPEKIKPLLSKEAAETLPPFTRDAVEKDIEAYGVWHENYRLSAKVFEKEYQLAHAKPKEPEDPNRVFWEVENQIRDKKFNEIRQTIDADIIKRLGKKAKTLPRDEGLLPDRNYRRMRRLFVDYVTNMRLDDVNVKYAYRQRFTRNEITADELEAELMHLYRDPKEREIFLEYLRKYEAEDEKREEQRIEAERKQESEEDKALTVEDAHLQFAPKEEVKPEGPFLKKAYLGKEVLAETAFPKTHYAISTYDKLTKAYFDESTDDEDTELLYSDKTFQWIIRQTESVKYIQSLYKHTLTQPTTVDAIVAYNKDQRDLARLENRLAKMQKYCEIQKKNREDFLDKQKKIHANTTDEDKVRLTQIEDDGFTKAEHKKIDEWMKELNENPDRKTAPWTEEEGKVVQQRLDELNHPGNQPTPIINFTDLNVLIEKIRLRKERESTRERMISETPLIFSYLNTQLEEEYISKKLHSEDYLQHKKFLNIFNYLYNHKRNAQIAELNIQNNSKLNTIDFTIMDIFMEKLKKRTGIFKDKVRTFEEELELKNQIFTVFKECIPELISEGLLDPSSKYHEYDIPDDPTLKIKTHQPKQPIARMPSEGPPLPDHFQITSDVRHSYSSMGQLLQNEWRVNIKEHRKKYVEEWGTRLKDRKEFLKKEYVNEKTRLRERKWKNEVEKRETERKEFIRRQAIDNLHFKQAKARSERRQNTDRAMRNRQNFQLEYLTEERNRKWISKEEDINESIFDQEFEITGFWHEDRPPQVRKSLDPMQEPPVPPEPALPFEQEAVPRVRDLVRPVPPPPTPDPTKQFPWLQSTKRITNKVSTQYKPRTPHRPF